MDEKLQAALAPLATVIRQRNALVYPVSQVALTLVNGPNTFSKARSEVLRWINGRAGRPLPEEAWQGAAFSLEEIGAQHAEAVGISSPPFWAARLDDADREIASRSWVTEAAIGESADHSIVFGARLSAVVRGQHVPYERSVPRFVRQIVANIGAQLDGRPLEERPWLIETEDDVEELVALIKNQRRRVDVIVAALAEGSTDVSTAIIDVEDIARRTIGAAHVAVITGTASYYLTELVGKEFSVFRRAVRTYRPGFNVDLDEPFAHPLGIPGRIAEWPNGGGAAYSRLIVSQALIRSVSAADSERLVPAFLTVKRTAAQIRLNEAVRAGSSDAELLALYETDNEDLRNQLAQEKEKSDALLVLAEEERDSALEAAQQAKETAHHLRRRIEILEAKSGYGSSAPEQTPTTLDDIQSWSEENLAGAVELHSRAYRGLKDSLFEDVSLIYASLLLLRDHYVPMRREGGNAKVEAFRKACIDLLVEESPTGSDIRAGEQGEEYFVRYGGRRIFLDRHLKKGNSRDPRFAFRLYFFWDNGSEQVVVGWLPSHLDNRIT